MTRGSVAARTVSIGCILQQRARNCAVAGPDPFSVLLQVAGRPAVAAKQRVVVAHAATSTLARKEVPLKLEEGEMPLNTYNNKKPFTGKIVSVERIVGPKATGETCNIVIETRGEIPFWEGQSYGVIPPVSTS